MANKTAFLNKIKFGALATWKKYGVLPSLVAAQAALESAWGTSGLATKGNNLFGIKAHSWRGPTITLPTKEFFDGKWITVDAKWRKYDSWADSVEDHGAFFVENPRYKKVLKEKDYVAACKAVKAAGYATDPEYADKLISTIKANNLDDWDKEAFGQKGVSIAKKSVASKRTTAAVVPYPGKSLKKGSKGKDVERIQRAVGVKVDGEYGPATEKAVKAYQKRKGLVDDGITGIKTWNMMF